MTSESALQNNENPIALRRDFHRYPETAFLEYRTASKVAEYLDGLGYDVAVGPEVMEYTAIKDAPSDTAWQAAMAKAESDGGVVRWMAKMPKGMTGVVATYRFGAGPTVAFRFDMDALNVCEVTDNDHLPYRDAYVSRYDGKMHACGHDGHVAIGLTLAERLMREKQRIGTVKLIFQPAEEGSRGSRPMVAAGVVDDVDFFFAGHLGCGLPSGKFAPSAVGFLSSTRLSATFRGSAAHAAMGPQQGRNALLAGAVASLNLHGIARHAEAATFVNVGKMTAGTAFNIVPDHCELLVEVRGADRTGHDYMLHRVQEILSAAAAMHGCTLATEIKTQMPGSENSFEAVRLLKEAAATVGEFEEVLPSWPIGGGDDATLMIGRVQDRGGVGAYCIIGSDLPAVHHAPNFDIDEATLEPAAKLYLSVARSLLA